MHSELTCELQEIAKYFFLSEDTSETKWGRYCSTNFWDIKDYGSKRWVVCVRIELEDSSLFSVLTKDEIVDRCLNHLNKPPPRRKYAKKQPKPKYGVLKHYRSRVITRAGERVISALLITDDKKNKSFWGKGKNA